MVNSAVPGMEAIPTQRVAVQWNARQGTMCSIALDLLFVLPWPAPGGGAAFKAVWCVRVTVISQVLLLPTSSTSSTAGIATLTLLRYHFADLQTFSLAFVKADWTLIFSFNSRRTILFLLFMEPILMSKLFVFYLKNLFPHEEHLLFSSRRGRLCALRPPPCLNHPHLFLFSLRRT